MATLAELFFPLCAVVINWLFLNTELDWVQIVGGVILVLGSTVIQLKENYRGLYGMKGHCL